MLGGLHYAHTRVGADGKPLGLVHRDVSPQNVLVTYEGAVKLVDFGIAKATRAVNAAQTQAGLLKGKYAYMSPEQARGQPVDARCRRLLRRRALVGAGDVAAAVQAAHGDVDADGGGRGAGAVATDHRADRCRPSSIARS